MKYSYLLLFILVLFTLPTAAQRKDKDTILIPEIIIEKKLEVSRIIKKIVSNIDKNYPAKESLYLKTEQYSTKNKDTIVAFDGIINFIIPNYKKYSTYYFHMKTNLCSYEKRSINKQQFIEWFPSAIGMLSKYQVNESPAQRLLFFINNSYHLLSIKRIPFILWDYTNFDFEIDSLENQQLKLTYTSKNKNYPLAGYVIIDRKTYAVLENYYYNTVQFSSPEYSHNDEISLVKTLEIRIKYQKSTNTDRYSFSSLEGSSVFETNNFSQFTAYSKVEKINKPKNCLDNNIMLADLGLIFKQNNKEVKVPSFLKDIEEKEEE